MKRNKILVIIAVVALSAGVFAQQSAATPTVTAPDTARTVQPRSPQSQSQPSMNKVQRPTKQTNWSKIKTMFE